jgi:hypothetical protein
MALRFYGAHYCAPQQYCALRPNQTRRMVCSKEKELQIERLIIFHLKKLKWEFESKLYCEDYISWRP